MLDRDLAILYGVGTKVLKQAVRRNSDRFPEDFMFEMTKDELIIWRSQIVTSNSDIMGLRYAPYCFTEQGVTMLSCILNSKRAIEVNIRIIRIFTRMNKTAIKPACRAQKENRVCNSEPRLSREMAGLAGVVKW